jgi:RNA polymerase sigma-70 factor (ECF subfamily)
MFLLALLGGTGTNTDEEIVRRFCAGDRHAFSELTTRYQDRVYTICLRWMGNRQVAEEIAQDVFIALYKSLDRFRGESKLYTWIYRVTINHCKNARLRRKRRAQDRHEPLEGRFADEDGPTRELPSPNPGTETGVHRSEADKILQDALAQVDDDHRDILILRDIQDLSYEEISDILSLPRGTVKSRLHRARAELGRVLSKTIRREDVFGT